MFRLPKDILVSAYKLRNETTLLTISASLSANLCFSFVFPHSTWMTLKDLRTHGLWIPNGGGLKMKSWTEAFISLPSFIVPLTWTWERQRWQVNCQRFLRCTLSCIKLSESHLISDFWHMDSNLWFPPLSRYHTVWLSRCRRQLLHFHNPKLKMKSRATF